MDLTLAGAFAAGLATSLHCAGMCGPLACGVGTFAKNEGERMAAAATYHAGRLTAYTTIGGICGAIGKEPLGWFFHSPAVLLPWVLVLVLLVLATGLEKKVPRPAFLTRLMIRVRFKTQRLPVVAGAGLTGLFTPFLPCGPLYAVFLALLASGSAARGMEVALAFGVGTVPLLWVAQHQFHRLRRRLSPATFLRVQRGLALTAALVLAWRLHDTIPLRGEESVAEKPLPACCH
ncbi:sulfite exporter TauE/SafE family protein [Luteolibacter luteus]|uniref:Sulfite exporter TauE/SafE family protein n=1 Tax=Luteolibacter luteus TaxID=2728835 RepID=A0A858RE70_9BACT|nr:sulfite exporter TauE/SafE family protein [Luteolibacter luteus]QJE95386.1 sulfite exporter TauE/SafE family protein [Luteolibacter luteus]